MGMVKQMWMEQQEEALQDELRERALEYFGAEIEGEEGLAELKGGHPLELMSGSRLTKISSIRSIKHLDYLIDRWHLADEFEMDDEIARLMARDD